MERRQARTGGKVLEIERLVELRWRFGSTTRCVDSW
jgi:hypothetical protein